MTDAVPGTGCPRQPDPRLSSADRTLWTLLGRPVPQPGLSISPDGGTFTLEMQNVAVVDQPRWPALDSIATPAHMGFRNGMEINRRTREVKDASKHLRFTGTRATCQLEAQVNVPAIGFSWKSDPLNTSKCDFAVIGDEVNGSYYDS